MSGSVHRGSVTLTSASGLAAECNREHGALQRLALGEVVVNLFVGNALEGGPANLVLRRHGERVTHTPLIGPRSPTRWRAGPAADRREGSGGWHGLRYRIALQLAADRPAWFWHVRVENTGAQPVRIDLVALQDLALAPYSALRLNEFYVSQYLDHTPLAHPQRGTVLATRQNQAVGRTHPWCVIGSLQRAVGFATDALQVHGLARRLGESEPGLAGDLPSTRLQHEHALAALQDAPCDLAPGASIDLGFFGRLLADHPSATSAADLAVVDETLRLAEATPPPWPRDPEPDADAPATSLFTTAPLLGVREPLPADLAAWCAGSARRHAEFDADGQLLGFFHGADRHVALLAKERGVLRPHGLVLRTGLLSVPDESALTTTAWMGGVFHSMLTQGHVSINRCLSTVRSYLGLFRSHGLRVFVEIEGAWQLLDQPSAFEMAPDTCRWLYRHDGGCIEVRSEARSEPHAVGLAVRIVDGPATRCLVSLHVALNGDDGSTASPVPHRRDGGAVVFAPAADSELGRRFPDGHWRIEPADGTVIAQVGGDELLFADRRSRTQPYLVLVTAPARAMRFAIVGRLVTDGVDMPARDAAGAGAALLLDAIDVPPDAAASGALGRLGEWLPWLRQNALIHFLSPRGLEQFSGGGWGTRDVCQGPLELLLADGHTAPMRELLLRVMRAQRSDGDWPQWFMFFERDAAIRAGDSHGDIVFWPLLALAQYLIASGDAAILDESVPFVGSRGSKPTKAHPVAEHVRRALAVTRKRTIAGTALAAYGHGDWNDALQPADPLMREHMCSAWTVTLHHQTLTTLARALRHVGRPRGAAPLERRADAIRADFHRWLLVDGVLAGYALFERGAGAAPRYLLHPRDASTGVRYSALAMIHAILEGLFDVPQMREHLRLIDAHLSGPDGARLFDAPLPYHGGLQRHFQRAESASFFGREIGLMYMHAHLRYAQALAHAGEAERFFEALCKANPIGLRELVPSAARRQSNCYYSSSDARFADRAQASAEYHRVRDGTIELDGGWRVYSSGAGILFGLVVRQLFGLRLESDALLVDPVLPRALDGTRIRVTLRGQALEIVYRVEGMGAGVTALRLGDRALPFTEVPNPYRRGAARVSLTAFDAMRAGLPSPTLHVHVG